MTFSYLSYSSGLTDDEKLIVDKQTSRNLEKIITSIKTLASNFSKNFSNVKVKIKNAKD